MLGMSKDDNIKSLRTKVLILQDEVERLRDELKLKDQLIAELRATRDHLSKAIGAIVEAVGQMKKKEETL